LRGGLALYGIGGRGGRFRLCRLFRGRTRSLRSGDHIIEQRGDKLALFQPVQGYTFLLQNLGGKNPDFRRQFAAGQALRGRAVEFGVNKRAGAGNGLRQSLIISFFDFSRLSLAL
jgi:hypothetical protein